LILIPTVCPEEAPVDEPDRTPTTVETERLRPVHEMPKEVGVLLMIAGIGGMMLPGPVGSPLFILGGVILWPRAFRGLEARLARRFPKLHRQSMRQVSRMLDDLDRRYPRPG
jgi:hypothetical protein